MGSGKRYSEEFKVEAVRQVIERGHAVSDVAKRLGVSAWSLSRWVRDRRRPEAVRVASADSAAELQRLKGELRRVTEERDILKKAAAYFAKVSG
jgi:transposase